MRRKASIFECAQNCAKKSGTAKPVFVFSKKAKTGIFYKKALQERRAEGLEKKVFEGAGAILRKSKRRKKIKGELS